MIAHCARFCRTYFGRNNHAKLASAKAKRAKLMRDKINYAFQPSTWLKNSAVFLGATLLAAALTGTAQAQSQGANAQARYVLSLSGNIIADLSINLNSQNQRYAIDLSARIAGLGNLVANGSATASVSGTVGARKYQGERFALNTLASDGNVAVNVSFTNGNVSAFTIDPPLTPRIDQVPIERAHLTGLNDGLSAFILKSDRFDQSLCAQRLKVFTGFERFNINMNFLAQETATSTRTGYQGPVILCQIDYTPVSGHYSTSEITSYLEHSDRILIWYAPVGQSGTFIPYRVLVGTAMGDLSMVLTQLSTD